MDVSVMLRCPSSKALPAVPSAVIHSLTLGHTSVTQASASVAALRGIPVCPRRPVTCLASQAQRPAETNLTSVAAPFHLAFPVRDVEEARSFYGGQVLPCLRMSHLEIGSLHLVAAVTYTAAG